MAEIANHFDGVELSETQRAIVDVFGGLEDNLSISVLTQDGKTHRIVMRQGNELNAGTKHALYRHFNIGVGVITSNDIISIPDIVANGVRTEKRRGNTRLAEYKLSDVNGNEFTVLTEIKKGKEIFNDFYSNKKASLSGTFNTQSAHTANNNTFSADKDTENISDVQEGNNSTRPGNGNVTADKATLADMRGAVEDVATPLNVPIEVLESTEELTGHMARAKGFYDKAAEKDRKQIEFVQPIINSIVNGTHGFLGSGETGRRRDGGEYYNLSENSKLDGERKAIDGVLLHNSATEEGVEATKRARRERRERRLADMRQAIEDVAAPLNVPVEVLESADELTGRMARILARSVLTAYK
jgi:hypothetical protein